MVALECVLSGYQTELLNPVELYSIVKIFANERGEASTSRREGALNSKDAAIG